eukprot:12339534-Ditylum_brightwellii.AAC.1
MQCPILCHEDAVADCTICLSHEETWTHLIQCQHTDSVALRTLAITAFKFALIKLETAPILRDVLCYKVAQWCKMPPLNVPRIPNDEVGEGHISIKWKVAQGMFKAVMPTDKNFNRDLWSSKVITAVWSIFWHSWNARNAHLHTEMAEMHSSILDKQVRKAFSLKHSMFATD